MQALGLIETKGLLVALESADAMLKAADVDLLEKTYVGGGLVSIAVTGEVAAVKAAVDAGVAAVKQINSSLLLAQHVIPRPHEELDGLIVSFNPNEEVEVQTIDSEQREVEEEPIVENSEVEEEPIVENSEVEEIRVTSSGLDGIKINKSMIDQMVLENGLEEALKFLGNLQVIKLRSLAREYKKIGIEGRQISKANKKTLLTKIKEFYDSFKK